MHAVAVARYRECVSRTPYDKQAVLNDIAENKLRPEEIAEKHGITVGNLYNIKAVAKRRGILNSRGLKTIDGRLEDEASVFTPEIRERIKDLRDHPNAYTSTEISKLLNAEGIHATPEDVMKVMARGANKYSEHRPGSGKARVQLVD